MKRAAFLFSVLNLLLFFPLGCGSQEGQEREPNDDRFHAQMLGKPGGLQGSFRGGASDIDLFRIHQESRERLDFEFDMDHGPFEQIRLLRLEGGVMKQFPGSLAPRGHFEWNVVLDPGDYFLELSGTFRKETTWRLTWRRGSADRIEAEPNDTPETATELIPNQRTEGWFFPPDEDWFHIPGPEKGFQSLNLDVSAVSGVDAFLEVFDGTVNALMRVDEGAPGEGESFRRLRLGTNGVFVKVHQRGPSVFKNKPYALFPETSDADPQWELEPNNDGDQANPWPTGRDEVYGLMAWRGDVDRFIVEGPAEGARNLVVQLEPPPTLSLALAIRGPKGELLGILRDLPPGAPLAVTQAIKPGEAVQVSVQASGRTSDPSKRYILRRQFRPLETP